MASLVPITGSTPSSYVMPDPHIGSDNPSSVNHEQVSEVVHQRGGMTVSVRRRTSAKKWTVSYNALPYQDVNRLKEYFDIRVFTYLPYGLPTISYNVRWLESEFKPVQVSPGVYSLAFTLEQVGS